MLQSNFAIYIVPIFISADFCLHVKLLSGPPLPLVSPTPASVVYRVLLLPPFDHLISHHLQKESDMQLMEGLKISSTAHSDV